MFKHIENVIHHSINLDHYKVMLSQPLLKVSFSAPFGKKFQRSLKIIERDYGKIDIISSHFPTTSFGPLYFKQKLQPYITYTILMEKANIVDKKT